MTQTPPSHPSDESQTLSELQLQQSWDTSLEHKLSAIFSRAAVGLSELNLDGSFLRVNDELCQILGRSRSELLASSVVDVTHPDDISKSIEALKHLVEPGARVSLDKRYMRSDGTVVWANSTLTRLDDEQGNPTSILAVTVDLSDRQRVEDERRQAEEQLRESEERYRAIVNQAVTGIAHMTLSGKLTLVNQKYCDVTGYTADELSERRMQDITHPNDLPHNVELFNRMVTEGVPFETEKRYIRKDKSVIWVNNHVSLIRDRDGNPQSAVAIVLDITARKRAELNDQFLATVSQTLLGATSPNQIVQTVGTSLNQYLNTSVCAFVEINATNGEAIVNHAWHQDGIPRITGTYILSDLVSAEFSEAIRTGQAIIIRDTATDPRITDQKRFADLAIGSFINVPLRRDNEWRFVLGTYHLEPYDWRTDEIELMCELSNRIWHQIERTRAEAALQTSEARYRALFTSVDAGYLLVDLVHKDGVESSVDAVCLEANPAAIRMLQHDPTGHCLREAALFQEAYWQQIFEHVTEIGEDVHLELHADLLQTWFDFHIFKMEDEDTCRVAIVFNDITARKQIDLALRGSEEQFRSMADHAPFMVWVADANGNCTYLSQSWYDFTGQPEETGIAFGWLRGIHPAELENAKQAFSTANRRQVPFRLEYRLRHREGQYIWVIEAATPWFAGDGQFRGYIGSVIDINDRKQAESALRRSEERYRTLFDSIDEGFCVIELLFDSQNMPIDYRFLEVNPAFEQQCGLLKAEGKRMRELVPNHEERWFKIYGQVALTGQSIRFEDYAAGLHRWFEVYAFRVGQPEKRQVGVVFKDISDRKKSEAEREQLLANERHYANQLQGLTTAALSINSALSVEDVLQVITQQAASIIGAHQAVTSLTIHQNWAQAINAIYLSDKYAQWREYEENPDGTGIYTYACQLNHPLRMTQAELEAHPYWKGFSRAAGKHPPLRGWLAAPLVGRDGSNIGLIQLSDRYEGDFTGADESILVQLAQMASVAVENARLYEAEQRARTAAETSREEAQAANRVKDEFLAVLSHELRSPLNPILGWSTLLQNNKLDAAKTAQALSTIQRNAKLQSELIEDLLDVSRILRGKLSLSVAPVHLVAIIEAAMETVRLAAEAKFIQIETYLDTEVGQVLGDSTRLQQVVWNLLSNAVKFTPAGGQVRICLERVISQTTPPPKPAPGSPLLIPPQRPVQHHAQITVSDTGKGIDPDFLPYVFDYFRQANSATTRKFGGLGLGLAIVRHLVELHGGTIQADSPGEGLGATFTLRLPLMPVQPPLSTAPSPSELILDLNDVRVLVVDDDADTRQFTAFLLEQVGARVEATASAGEACAALAQNRFDVLLSDIGMPEMDGYMLLQRVRSLPLDQGGQIPAIALTAYAGELDQQQALKVGFQRHLAKPIDPEVLVRAIADLIRPN